MIKRRRVRLFRYGRNQVLRIPRNFEIEGDEAILRKEGDRLILVPIRTGCLLTVRKQGRHKYFTLANESGAALLETLMGLSAGDKPFMTMTGPRDAAMRNARVCYNHLAGNKGIQLHDSLLASIHLVMKAGTLMLSSNGERFMQDFGIDMETLQASRSPL